MGLKNDLLEALKVDREKKSVKLTEHFPAAPI